MGIPHDAQSNPDYARVLNVLNQTTDDNAQVVPPPWEIREETAWQLAQTMVNYQYFAMTDSSRVASSAVSASQNDSPTLLPSQPMRPYHLQNNRTLVIIMGNLRGGEQTWATLYRHVLDINQADLALVVGKLDPQSPLKKSSMFLRASYVHEFDEYSDWGQAIDELVFQHNNISNWRQDLMDHHDVKWGLWGGVSDQPGSGAVIFMIRAIVKQYLVKNPRILHKYKRFILTRSDHYYGCAHDLSLLDARYMWVPVGEDYNGGITDRHAIFNRHHILPGLDIMETLVRYPTKFGSNDFFHITNPERLIRLRWEQEGLWKWVRRYPRNLFTCAVSGDPTRWTQANMSRVVREGVSPKYPYEYEETQCICHDDCHSIDRANRRRKRAGY